MRWGFAPNAVYGMVKQLVENRDYFVYSSSGDGGFERTGFDRDRIYTPQGDFSYYQCLQPCRPDAVFSARSVLERLLPCIGNKGMTGNMTAPKCIHCGGPVAPNVRLGSEFIHKPYDSAKDRFQKWVMSCSAKHAKLVVIDVDSCFQTPRVTSFLVSSMVQDITGSSLVRLSFNDCLAPTHLERAVGLLVDPTGPQKFISNLVQLALSANKNSKEHGAAEERLLDSRRQKALTRSKVANEVNWTRILDLLDKLAYNSLFDHSM